VTPPDMNPVGPATERRNNFSKTIVDVPEINGHQTERSPVFNISRRSLSK
jgi:hypothetical protein